MKVIYKALNHWSAPYVIGGIFIAIAIAMISASTDQKSLIGGSVFGGIGVLTIALKLYKNKKANNVSKPSQDLINYKEIRFGPDTTLKDAIAISENNNAVAYATKNGKCLRLSEFPNKEITLRDLLRQGWDLAQTSPTLDENTNL